MKKELLFISMYDVNDKKAWSGTIHTIYTSLSNLYSITSIQYSAVQYRFINKLRSKFDFVNNSLLIPIKRFCNLSSLMMIKVNKKCDSNSVIIAPIATDYLALNNELLRDKKIVYISDATFHLLDGYYWSVSDLERVVGNDNECSALSVADAVIYSSDWAASDCSSYYSVPTDKVFVVPFGANLPDHYKPDNCLLSEKKCFHMLLVGVDWNRKGVQTAIDCVDLLNELSDLNYRLSIVGLDKPDGFVNPNVSFYGFLNKNNPNDLKKIISIYQSSDLFILPTKAECSAIVFAEAAEYGLPCFTYNTGGVSTYVLDGITGRCLDPSSDADGFAHAILDSLIQGTLDDMSVEARYYYSTTLNWDAWLNSVSSIINGIANND